MSGSKGQNTMPELKLCGDFVIKPNWAMNWRELNEYELVYFPTGTGSTYWLSETETYPLDTPCVVVTQPRQNHRYIFNASHSIRHMFAHFIVENEELIRHLREIPPVLPLQVSMIPLLFKHILFLSSHRPLYWLERSNALLYAMILEISGLHEAKKQQFEEAEVPIQITSAIEYIKKNLQKPISIKKLAELAGWRHEYFTRKFIEYTGISPKRMILQRRIDQASELLMVETLSIKEIAAMTGFQNEHYFSRVFSMMKGMPATEFRKRFSASNLIGINVVPVDDLNDPYSLNRYYYSDLPSASRTYYPPEVATLQYDKEQRGK